jgi:CHAT domain-containing protein/tetratricopeptide (TPR) repeat protein
MPVAICIAAALPCLAADAPRLTLGAPAAAALASGDVHPYELTLDAGDFARVELVPDGIDAGLSLAGPDGASLFDVTPRSGSATTLAWVAKTSGRYGLRVHALETSSREGRYTVTLHERRPARPPDAARVRAVQALIGADRLWTESRNEKDVADARRGYESAIVAAQAGADPALEGVAALNLGRARHATGTPETALEPLERALALARRRGDTAAECAVRCAAGWVLADLARSEDALGEAEQAAAIADRTGDARCLSEALNVAGEAWTLTGHNTESPSLYADALAIARGARDRRGEAQTQLDAGYALADMSRIDEARTAYDAAIALFRATGERRGEVRAVIALGQLNSIVGARQRALDLYRVVQGLVEALDDGWSRAVIESGFGMANLRMGEFEAAIPHYRIAVGFFREAKMPHGESANLLSFASALAGTGRYDEALQAQTRALELARSDSNVRIEARALQEIALLRADSGRLDQALADYDRALAQARSVGDTRAEAMGLTGLGDVLVRLGRTNEAEARFERALAVAEQGGDPFLQSSASFGLARVQAARGDLERALRTVQSSLALGEGLRAAVASLDLRASYVASIRARHELEVDLLTRLHERSPAAYPASLAFEASERTRARSLLDALADAQGRIHEGVDPALLREESSLGERLNLLATRRGRMLRDERGSAAGRALEAEIDRTTDRIRDVRARMRAESARYVDLVEPRPIGLADAQRTILDDRTVLLQYFLGGERSHMWAVTRTGITAYVLPSRERIEALVGACLQDVAHAGPTPDAGAAERAMAVSQAILGPAAAHLDAARLVVVADGLLESLPFAVLPDPRPTGGEPLAKTHEIVTLPSASTLALSRASRPGERRWTKDVLVVADPVFEADDPRLPRAVAAGRAPEKGPVLRAPRESDPRSLPRLLGSRAEARQIAALAAASDVALGFEASRAAALAPGVKDHRVVHFATHTIVDQARPDLSGIALSMFDERGTPRDGFVRLHDVYNMTLPVDLVVLSGCSSAQGKPLAGEGLISLVRGFMYAGTRRVVASRWKVDDDATAALMVSFYRGLWRDGLTPSAALAAAQREMMGEKRWQHPFYWGAFVLSGDWER